MEVVVQLQSFQMYPLEFLHQKPLKFFQMNLLKIHHLKPLRFFQRKPL
jgi:hypothetical protein